MGQKFKLVLFSVDFGFIIYWTLIGLNMIPQELALQDYTNPIVKAWNWSFFPLDIAASITGFFGLRKAGNYSLLLISLTLTMIAGGMAIAFWTIQEFFDPTWWIPNLLLFVIGLVSLIRVTRSSD
jgi:hypothetical protein